MSSLISGTLAVAKLAKAIDELVSFEWRQTRRSLNYSPTRLGTGTELEKALHDLVAGVRDIDVLTS